MTIQISKISSPAKKKYHKKHHQKYHPSHRHFFREQWHSFFAMVSPWRWPYWIVSFPPAAQAFLQTCGLHGSSNLVFEAGKIWQRKVGKRKAVTRWEQQWTTICFFIVLCFWVLWHHPLCGQFPTTRQAHDMPSFFNKQSSAFIWWIWSYENNGKLFVDGLFTLW